MAQGSIERRRGRRANVQATILLRRGHGGPEAARREVATNVSLAGVYFETDDERTYQPNEVMLASVAVPGTQTRAFPFARLAGRGRVVRLQELPSQGTGGKQRIGVALEFGSDLTALTAMPERG